MTEAQPVPQMSADAPIFTILVVEDDVLVRTVAAAYLRESCFEVIEAGNAEEAMRVMHAGIGIDLVFSDVNMPGDMDGLRLAAWLNMHFPGVQVVLTSGALRSEQQTAELGVHRPFIPKPYDWGTLAKRIHEMLGR
jgi:CheY-like chemotaxis protein